MKKFLVMLRQLMAKLFAQVAETKKIAYAAWSVMGSRPPDWRIREPQFIKLEKN